MTEQYCGYYKSPIGLLEIICTEDTLVSAMFVEKRKGGDELNPYLEKALLQFDEYFKGERLKFDLFISFNGTVFQNKVWKELLAIPYGDTISYKDLAVRVGNVKATRAVGNANGKNMISIVVPCHRVIGSNKSLTGYAGGLERKEWLLEHERRIAEC